MDAQKRRESARGDRVPCLPGFVTCSEGNGRISIKATPRSQKKVAVTVGMECGFQRAEGTSTGSERTIHGGFGETPDVNIWAEMGALSYIVGLERSHSTPWLAPGVRMRKGPCGPADSPLDDTVMLPSASHPCSLASHRLLCISPEFL